jgi:hypothetical protein
LGAERFITTAARAVGQNLPAFPSWFRFDV